MLLHNAEATPESHAATIKLNKPHFKGVISVYEAKIFHFIELSYVGIEKSYFNPHITMFDYDDHIICNHKFRVAYNELGHDKNAEFRIDILKADDDPRVFVMILNYKNNQSVNFDWISYSKSFEDCEMSDYKIIVKKFMDKYVAYSLVGSINAHLFVHQINFDNGSWNIKKRY